MKLKRVVIEGFHNIVRKEYDFDEINYLHGPNGAGKSSVLQAIQLGLLGYVPGSNKTKQGIFAHSNNHTMAVKLILDDLGQPVSIQRIWTKVKNTVSESVEVVPSTYQIKDLVSDIELPVFNFNDFMHMTANTMKDWFLDYLPRETYNTDWNKVLKESLDERSTSILDVVGESFVSNAVNEINMFGIDGIEEVRAANIYFKSQLSFMKAELTRKVATIQSLVFYDDYVPTCTEQELEKLIVDTENSVVNSSVLAEKLKTKYRILEDINMLESQEIDVDSLNEKYKLLVARKKDIEAELDSLQELLNSNEMKISSYSSIVESKGICPFTSNKCEEISSLVDKYKNEIKSLVESSSKIQEGIDYRVVRLNEISSEINETRLRISREHDRRLRLDSLKKSYEEFESVDDKYIDDVDLLQKQLESYKDMYGKAVANRKYEELNSVIVNDKYRIEMSIEALKCWIDLTSVNGLQSQNHGDNPFEALAAKADLILNQIFKNKQISCKFNSDGRSNSFSFGINRDNQYIPFNLLSSGEKCLFMVSLFISLLDYTKSTLKLILIDDFLDHLDELNFNILFDAIKDIKDIQFIFAGVKPTYACNVIEIS